jgi:hypothetical protein
VSPRNLRLQTRSMMNRRPGGVEQASAATNACCYRFPAGGRGKVVYTFCLIPESLVVWTVTAIRGAVGRGMDVVRTASFSVSGVRSSTGAAAGQGCHLAGQIVNPLQQVSGVGGLGD